MKYGISSITKWRNANRNSFLKKEQPTVKWEKDVWYVPSILKRDFASGDDIPALLFGKSALPCSITGFPGRNIKDCGFGVDWVCMNKFLCCPIELTYQSRIQRDISVFITITEQLKNKLDMRFLRGGNRKSCSWGSKHRFRAPKLKKKTYQNSSPALKRQISEYLTKFIINTIATYIWSLKSQSSKTKVTILKFRLAFTN